MAILVDEPREWASGIWCHMMSDLPGQEGLDELHAMADTIGMKRRWFQNKPTFPHYDLRRSKRKLAVAAGAEEVKSDELVRRCKKPLEIIPT